MKPLRILAIDGGWIRGVISAVVIAHISDRLKQPVMRLFDVLAGTSTGGIIALGLADSWAASRLWSLRRPMVAWFVAIHDARRPLPSLGHREAALPLGWRLIGVWRDDQRGHVERRRCGPLLPVDADTSRAS